MNSLYVLNLPWRKEADVFFYLEFLPNHNEFYIINSLSLLPTKSFGGGDKIPGGGMS